MLISDREHDDFMLMLASGIHEAGHVLAAREFGFNVEWVSLDPDFLRSNPMAIENKCASGFPVTMTITSHLLTPIANRGCVTSRDEWETIRRYYIECHAGPLAEIHFNPHFQIEAGQRDFEQSDGLLWHLMKPDKFRFKRKRAAFIKDAQTFVEQHRNTIFYLGVEIHNRRTLFANEIDAAIAYAKEQAASMKEAA